MPRRLGMITPSSNSVLEPVTAAMLAASPDVTAHFSRLRVTEIALDAPALGQFDPGHMLAAAELLADAKVDAIAWNGTSASWLGIAPDHPFGLQTLPYGSFTTRDRPVRSARGWTAAPVRHGVSAIRSGRRFTLGLVMHDAA